MNVFSFHYIESISLVRNWTRYSTKSSLDVVETGEVNFDDSLKYRVETTEVSLKKLQFCEPIFVLENGFQRLIG